MDCPYDKDWQQRQTFNCTISPVSRTGYGNEIKNNRGETIMKDGLYFLHPEGSSWIGAIFKNEKLVTTIEACNAATHAAANDSLADIVPQDADVEVDDEDECKEIIKEVMGEDTHVEMVIVTRPAPEYVLHMNDGCSTNEVTFTEKPDDSEIHSEIEDWCKDGEWGDDGAAIGISWTLEFDGDEIDNDYYTVDIEPNHSVLIANACGRDSRSCGDDPDDHDWTAEGEGGCTENPGVWSTGGTSMSFATHCRKCGLHRNEYSTGSQKNPGEHDTIDYEMPDTWCEECEDEKCRC